LRYVRLLLIIAVIAILASSAVFASRSTTPPTVVRSFVEGSITALTVTDSADGSVTVTPPVPPAGSKLPVQAPVTFSVDSASKISLDGKASSIGDLAVDDQCAAFLLTSAGQTIALSVDATSPHVFGTITALDTDSAGNNFLTIQPFSPPFDKTALPDVQLQVTSNTIITKMGTSSYSELLVGDVVAASYQGSDMVAIEVDVQPLNFAGSVVSVDSVGGVITVANPKTTLAFGVVSGTKIYLNGRTAALSAILPKDLAEVVYFQFSTGNVAAVIDAAGPIKLGPGFYIH